MIGEGIVFAVCAFLAYRMWIAPRLTPAVPPQTVGGRNATDWDKFRLDK